MRAGVRQFVLMGAGLDTRSIRLGMDGVKFFEVEQGARFPFMTFIPNVRPLYQDKLPAVTNIDGLDIHYIHVRSKHKGAMPVIITHGWPGSIIEQMKVIAPLTDPTAYGGKEEDAFDVVIPSLPGYGFSGKPTATGWDPQRVARAWITLMKRLGYEKYVAQGGDWGNAVTEQMALIAPPGLLGTFSGAPWIPDPR